MSEKNDRRLAANAWPDTVFARDGSKFGPAEPTRMKSTMTCGSQAKLQFVLESARLLLCGYTFTVHTDGRLGVQTQR